MAPPSAGNISLIFSIGDSCSPTLSLLFTRTIPTHCFWRAPQGGLLVHSSLLLFTPLSGRAFGYSRPRFALAPTLFPAPSHLRPSCRLNPSRKCLLHQFNDCLKNYSRLFYLQPLQTTTHDLRLEFR